MGRGQLDDHGQDVFITRQSLFEQFGTSSKRSAVCVVGPKDVAVLLKAVTPATLEEKRVKKRS